MRILNEMELDLVEGGCFCHAPPSEPECPPVSECDPTPTCEPPAPVCKPKPHNHHHHYHLLSCLSFLIPRWC
jgi:hypothetical protein